MGAEISHEQVPFHEVTITQAEAVRKSGQRLKEAIERPVGLYGWDCGIHDLNIMLQGWQPGKSYTIGARSGVGKTSIIVPVIEGGARVIQGKKAEFLFFSWEMTADYIVDRSVCHNAGITATMLTQGAKFLTAEQKQAVRMAYEQAKKLPVEYAENSTNITTLRRQFSRFVRRCQALERADGIKRLPVAVVDYIGMAKFEEATGIRAYGIADFMNGIKKMCNEEGGAAINLAQLKRGADAKDMPDRDDLKDSSDIEMASDTLLLLHRPEYNQVEQFPDGSPTKNKIMIRNLKNRSGATGDTILNCDIKYNRFWHGSHDWDYQYWTLYQREDFWRHLLGL
jgi:replicative DNA helicase